MFSPSFHGFFSIENPIWRLMAWLHRRRFAEAKKRHPLTCGKPVHTSGGIGWEIRRENDQFWGEGSFCHYLQEFFCLACWKKDGFFYPPGASPMWKCFRRFRDGFQVEFTQFSFQRCLFQQVSRWLKKKGKKKDELNRAIRAPKRFTVDGFLGGFLPKFWFGPPEGSMVKWWSCFDGLKIVFYNYLGLLCYCITLVSLGLYRINNEPLRRLE